MHRNTEDATPGQGARPTKDPAQTDSDIAAPPGTTGAGPDESDLHNTGQADDGDDGERFDAG
ncbi:hypothetical protein ACTVCO_00255 [Sanguibacter sp. A247]|uniref:hypothetical protein n=1 Tax=unclassified Sanguibacter TaxID=2645534 RepID=UPI003FD6C6FD